VSQPRTAQQQRNDQVRVVLGANWAVALAKLGYGLYSHSTAMVADGLHSFIDGGSNVIGLVAMHFASAPADREHPYGHQKFEALAALAIGAMIGIGVLELGKLALDAVLHGSHPDVSLESFVVMIATLIINTFVTRAERRWGQKLGSTLLLADAQHTLSDVWVTLSVLVSLALSGLGLTRADGLVAFGVLGLVGYTGWQIIKQAVGILSDTIQLDPEAVRTVCADIAELRAVTEVRSRGMEGSVYVDLKIEVAPQLTVEKAHAVADQVEARLAQTYPQVVEVFVHVEPGVGA
jgi:cation diffusion facilitator family transporter